VTAFASLLEQKKEASAGAGKVDLSAMTALLANKWKSGGGESGQPEGVRAGQIRSFKITAIDLEKKKVEIEMQA